MNGFARRLGLGGSKESKESKEPLSPIAPTPLVPEPGPQQPIPQQPPVPQQQPLPPQQQPVHPQITPLAISNKPPSNGIRSPTTPTPVDDSTVRQRAPRSSSKSSMVVSPPPRPVVNTKAKAKTKSTQQSKEDLLMSLLASEAVMDSRTSEILSAEQVEELKKEDTLLQTRFASSTKKLALETKMRDAARSLATLNGGNKSMSKQTQEQLDEASQRLETAQADHMQIQARHAEVQRKLLEHRAGILSAALRKTDESLSVPSSSTISPTDTSRTSVSTLSKFDGAHFFAGHAESTGAPPMPVRAGPSPQDIQRLKEAEQTAKDATKRAAELSRDLGLLKLEKAEAETRSALDVQQAEEQVAELRGQVAKLTSKSQGWEKEREELLEDVAQRDKQIEELQDKVEAVERQGSRGGAASATEVEAELEGARKALRAIVRTHRINMQQFATNEGESAVFTVANMIAAIGSHIESLDENKKGLEKARREAEDEMQNARQAKEKIAAQLEESRQDTQESLRQVATLEFKRTIKRFLAENSPKSGLHARHDPSMPVPFLSFEGLRGRLSNGTSEMAGPNNLDYGATSGPLDAFDELESSTDGSGDEAPRHYQLQPLKKEVLVLSRSPEPIEDAAPPGRSKDVDVPQREDVRKPEAHSPTETSVSNKAPKEKRRATGETSSLITGTTRPSPEDQELSYYISHVFPVLHELAGFNLSSQDVLTLAQREPPVRAVLVAEAKHHQNRMKFLTSTDGPHHQATQKLCLDLAASNNAYVSALGSLSPVFEKATRANDIDTLAVLYTLLHFGGIGELLTRHIARRGNQGPAGFLLELSCRWLAGSIARYTDLASALRRGGERQRAVIQAAIHIDIYSSIALCRPPHFLDSYRASFRHGDLATTVDSNGVQMAVPRLDDLMDIPAKTLLALAEMSAMASWKAEHLRHGTLSVMDLSRWGKRIDALLAPPSAESLLPSASSLSPKRLSQSTVRGPSSNVAPIGPSNHASMAQPAQVNTKSIPPTASAVSPTISNPTTPTATVVKSEEGGANASAPAVPSTPVARATEGTLPLPSPTADSVDHEMEDSETVVRTAPKPSTSERSAAPPTPVDQGHQVPRPAYRRILPPATREVFRCAGRVFLHTILSGEHPRVHDIVQAVADTCGALRDLGLSYLPPSSRPTHTDDLRFPVVRGLPFCIFIAGCMAGNMEQGMFLRSCLRPVIREIDMQTSELLTAVLSERAGSGDAISWQSVMVKRGSRLVFM